MVGLSLYTAASQNKQSYNEKLRGGTGWQPESQVLDFRLPQTPTDMAAKLQSLIVVVPYWEKKLKVADPSENK